MEIELFNIPRSEWEKIIDEWTIGKNAERDRDILIRNLLDGITLEKLSEKHEITPRQASRIIAKRMQNLIKHI